MVGTGAGSGQQQVPDGATPALQQASTVVAEARVGSMCNILAQWRGGLSKNSFFLSRLLASFRTLGGIMIQHDPRSRKCPKRRERRRDHCISWQVLGVRVCAICHV